MRKYCCPWICWNGFQDKRIEKWNGSFAGLQFAGDHKGIGVKLQAFISGPDDFTRPATALIRPRGGR
jgi:hypothetical protein